MTGARRTRFIKNMRIELDDNHTLVSDAFCCWIEVTVRPEGKKPYTRRCSGYTATFEDCVVNYINSKILSSETSSIRDLAQTVIDLKKEVMSWKQKS